MDIPQSVLQHMAKYEAVLTKKSPKLAAMYHNCYPNTIETVLKPHDDGTTFVLTGDIPAMWLRDSTAQVSHYIPLCRDNEEMRSILRGVIRMQLRYVCMDTYANAFNEEANGWGHPNDLPKNDPWIWERKYEIDSLCYPLRLVELYVAATQDRTVLDETFHLAVGKILDHWTLEQHHMERSKYLFIRDSQRRTDNLGPEGVGAPVAYTGMTWSGFRPSDDSCTYGYLIPSEFFAVKVLRTLDTLLSPDDEKLAKAQTLACEIADGIQKYGIVNHPKYGPIYACEVDGFGNSVCMDDANVPSLLSLPYLGCVAQDDEIYANTRRFILSTDNPFYFEGQYARGIGSPHTPTDFIWHIALSMQGLTSTSREEALEILQMIENSDADTGFTHEGFHKDDPKKFTRSWFCWSNSLFAEFCEFVVEKGYLS